MKENNTKKVAFKTLNNYFDSIFVLTIERNKYRRECMKEEFKGLEYEFFYGIDGRNLDKEYIKNIYNEKEAILNVGRPMEVGEIATSLSHCMLYKRIIDDNLERVLIFEDDARFVESQLKYIVPILEELPEDWDLLYFGHQFYCCKLKFIMFIKIYFLYPLLNSLKIRKYDLIALKNTFIRKYSKHLMIGGSFTRTHCFGINQSTARKLYQSHMPIISNQCDRAIIRICRKGLIKTFSSIKQIFVQDISIPSSAWNLDA